MTQAQRTQTGANALGPAAVAGLVMVAALAGAILVYGLPTLSLTPETGSVTTNSALVRAESAWMQQRIQQSSAFDVMSVPNRQSADQWEAMQHTLSVGTAIRGSTLTEAERQRILRHQLMIQQGGSTTTALEAAQKLQIERQLQLAKITGGFVGQRKAGPVDPWSDSDVRTPTHPQLR